jgi:hypothetical protein
MDGLHRNVSILISAVVTLHTYSLVAALAACSTECSASLMHIHAELNSSRESILLNRQ